MRRGFPLLAELQRLVPGARVEVPEAARAELDRLVDRGAPRATAARAFAELLPTAPAPGRGDAAILAAALRRRAWVVTSDRVLVRRLREAGVTVLTPRDRHRLEVKVGRPRLGADNR